MSGYSSHLAHQSMVYDEVRNSAYARAIRAKVNSESVVLDLGSGLGLLGLIAAQAGARHVYLVDPSPVTQWARRVAKANGLEHKVTCIQAPIEDITLPEKVDLIISVFTGNFLLQEDLLPALFFARKQYLKPGGSLIPEMAEMRIVPASFQKLYAELIEEWSKPSEGIAMHTLREVAANTVAMRRLNDSPCSFLAKPQTACNLNFHSAVEASVKTQLDFEIDRNATLHGYIGWFRMKLGAEWLSTSPRRQAMHWSQAVLPVDPPLSVKQHGFLHLTLQRPVQGDWTWLSAYEEERRKHSTFYSQPLSPGRLKLAKKAHQPTLSQHGQLVLAVLRWANADLTIGEILANATAEYPHLSDIKTRVEGILAAHSLSNE